MADNVRRAEYFHVQVPDRPGEGARILASIKKAGIDLLAFSGFPDKSGQAQLDLVVADANTLEEAASREGLSLVGPRACFVVEGDNRVGAVADLTAKLADAKVSVTALDAVRVGSKYGALIFVKQEDLANAARALGAAAATRAA